MSSPQPSEEEIERAVKEAAKEDEEDFAEQDGDESVW